MVSILLVSRAKHYYILATFAMGMGISSVSYATQLIISCFICGSVGDRITKLNAVLDNVDENDLSDKAYKEWLMFATVMRNTRTFGFTIGGFAVLNKSTLIAVNTIILSINHIFILTNFLLFSDFYIYS